MQFGGSHLFMRDIRHCCDIFQQRIVS